MNVAGPQYGSYFPHPPHSQPRNFSYAVFPMGSENATTSTSSNMNKTVDPERPLSSNLVASNPVSASAKIGAKAHLTKWREEHSSVLAMNGKNG